MDLWDDITGAADQIREAEEVTIISHSDTDGITSEAIIALALSRLNISTRTLFVKQLDPPTLSQIPSDNSLKLFSDLGAGHQVLFQAQGLTEKEVLILDHHVSQPCDLKYHQVNGLPYGHRYISAAGITYLVAKALDPKNRDLAKLAVIGNVGDMMAHENCGLVGIARDHIVRDAVDHGNLEIRKSDLNCYGTSTRPLSLLLAYSDELPLEWMKKDPEMAKEFLHNLGIQQKTDKGRWRVWEELPHDERRTIISALAEQLISQGESLERLLEVGYYFPDEMVLTPLRNAKEYSTLINACGKSSHPGVAAAIIRGERGNAYREGQRLHTLHKAESKNLTEYIIQTGVVELDSLQYLHLGNRFRDTIIGSGASRALFSLNREKPILVMCDVPDDKSLTKVSMRTTQNLVKRGIDLQRAISVASIEYGGRGGGHLIAAGAYIPKSAEEVFVRYVNKILGEQFAEARPDHR